MTVGLNLGHEAPPGLADALQSAGFRVVDRLADVSVVTAAETEWSAVEPLVSRVVDGGALLICGGAGPLLAALHLTPLGGPVEGEVRPVGEGLESVGAGWASPVSGVGFVLYRIGEQCVALGGPRDRGVVAYLGDAAPAADLVIAALRWIERWRARHP
ncbi:MAG: hypothetical protein ACYTED_08400 [Planctomycetota bacterium]|jgi:hypothetical protein